MKFKGPCIIKNGIDTYGLADEMGYGARHCIHRELTAVLWRIINKLYI